jgi:hypothetical protein
MPPPGAVGRQRYGTGMASRFHLYCDGDYIYSTDDAGDAQSWVDADPAGHEARDTR